MPVNDVTNALHDFNNYPPGGPAAAAYAVDAAEMKEAFKDLSIGLGVMKIRGSDCLDKASGAAVALFYLRNQAGDHLLNEVDAGEHVIVVDIASGDYWEDVVQEDGTGAYLDIRDADFVGGPGGALPACTGAYTTEFTGWNIYVITDQLKFSKTFLHLINDNPGALTGDAIAVDPTAATTIHAALDTADTRLDGHCDGAGALITSVVTNLSLDKDEVLTNEHPISIAVGGDAEQYLYDPRLAYGLEVLVPGEYGDQPSTWVQGASVRKGLYSQQFVTAAHPQGFKVLLKPTAADLAGMTLTIVTWIRSTGGGDARIGFYDNVTGAQTTTKGLAAATITKHVYTATIGAGATTVYGVIAGDESPETYNIDSWAVYIGNVAFDDYIPSFNLDQCLRDNNVNAFKNYCPLPDFSYLGDASAGTGMVNSGSWIYGTAACPAVWNYNGAVVFSQELTNYRFGNASVHLEMPGSTYFYHWIGLRDGTTPSINPQVMELIGGPVTFTCLIRKTGANEETVILKIKTWDTGVEIDSYERTVNLTSFGTSPLGNYYWFSVTMPTVDSDTDGITVGIYNDAAAQCDLYLDYVNITKTDYPITQLVTNGWKLIDESWTYNVAGVPTATTDYMDFHTLSGGTDAAITNARGPLTINNVAWYGITAYETVGATGGAVDTYTVYGLWWDNSGGGAWTATAYGLDVAVSAALAASGMNADGLTRAAGEAMIPDYNYERVAIACNGVAGMGAVGTYPTVTLWGLVW